MLKERGIAREWVTQALSEPARTERRDDSTIHYLKPIPEHEGLKSSAGGFFPQTAFLPTSADYIQGPEKRSIMPNFSFCDNFDIHPNSVI
ncbi:MAG: hypothetical protein HQ578_04370 [Chloroflexi bacterium]|nr:hypothetical protein [Chloroflexota bacterium]